MAVVILLLGGAVELIAMPALAGLLIVVGVGTVKPAQIIAVAKTGAVPLTVMSITLLLTLVIPLQYAVLVGVGLSVILFVAQQSSRLVTVRLKMRDDDRIEEVEPPEELQRDSVIMIQPYGALFFATAPKLIEQMPTVTPESQNSVVILRIRGMDEAGSTLLDSLSDYAADLRSVDSKLVIVTDNDRVVRQFRVTGNLDAIGRQNVYRSTKVFGEATRQAHADAHQWVDSNRADAENGDSDE